MLAKRFSVFRSNPEITIFASGVSNSQETRTEEFERERRLLRASLDGFSGAHFVYFGSCGAVGNADTLSPYLTHKLQMEQWVCAHPNGIVFRLPQVVGPTDNPHTLTNFLRDRIMKEKQFEVWREAERNIVDIDDVATIVIALLEEGQIQAGNAYSIASTRSLKMIEIINIFERVLRKKAIYQSLPKGGPLEIDSTEAARIAPKLGIDFGDSYVEHVIQKYYGHSEVNP